MYPCKRSGRREVPNLNPAFRPTKFPHHTGKVGHFPRFIVFKHRHFPRFIVFKLGENLFFLSWRKKFINLCALTVNHLHELLNRDDIMPQLQDLFHMCMKLFTVISRLESSFSEPAFSPRKTTRKS